MEEVEGVGSVSTALEQSARRITEPMAKPEWLPDALDDTIRTLKLARAGRIPDKILGWMLVTSCLRVLRCVYGDDLTTCTKLREAVLLNEEAALEVQRAMERGEPIES